MSTAMLDRIPVPRAATKGVVWPRPKRGAGPVMVDEPSALVGLNTGDVKATVDENGARDPEMLTITNPGKQQGVPAKFKRGIFAKAKHAAQGASISSGVGWIQTGPGATAAPPASQTNQQVDQADKDYVNAQRQTNAASQQYLNQQRQANAASTNEEQAYQSAQNNSADQSAVGAARSIQGASDYKYGDFGIAPPQDVVNATPGTPGVRAALETQQQIVGRRNQQQQQLRDLSLRNGAFDVQQADINARGVGLNAQDTRINARNSASTVSRGGPAYDPNAANDAARAAASARGAAIGRARGDTGINTTNVPVGRGTGVGDYTSIRGGSYGGAANNAATANPQNPASPNFDRTQALRTAQTKQANTIEEDPITGEVGFHNDINARHGGPEGLAFEKYDKTIVRDPITDQPTTRGDLDSRTDKFGNVRQQDGSYTDPKSRNSYRQGPQGLTWYSPEGNYQIDAKTWGSPEGFKYTIENPKSGGGYWQDANGFVLKNDGLWQNPATGEAFTYVNGAKVKKTTGGSINLGDLFKDSP